MYKPKVYTASNIPHFKLWQNLYDDPEWMFCEWTASWVTHPDIENEVNQQEISGDVFRQAWLDNLRDIKASDFLLLYSGGEALRGALVEAGSALGLGITVVAVGLPNGHSWAFHPGVVTHSSLRSAREYLYRFTVMIPPVKKKSGARIDED